MSIIPIIHRQNSISHLILVQIWTEDWLVTDVAEMQVFASILQYTRQRLPKKNAGSYMAICSVSIDYSSNYRES